MGATIFVTMYGNASRESVRDAFTEAQAQARYEYGHNGYTGTIAEVSDYKQFSAPADIDQIIDDPRSGVDRDTCGYFIDPDNGAYVFFGLARL